jgi:predicted metalloprotease with PDZ domain
VIAIHSTGNAYQLTVSDPSATLLDFRRSTRHTAAMRKRVQIALAVLLVALAGLCAWQVLRQPKPVYRAKWLTRFLKTPGMSNHAPEHVTGVGVALGAEGRTIKIMQVLPHTPASKAGLVPGLVVRDIDGTTTDGKLLKECVDMLRGAVGTKVRLELVDLENGKTNTVELTRERVL